MRNFNRLRVAIVGFFLGMTCLCASLLGRIADALDRAYPAPRKVTASER